MDNDNADGRYISPRRRYTLMSQKGKNSYRKNTRRTRRAITLGMLLVIVVVLSCIQQPPSTKDFPPVTIHLDSKEKLKEFEPIQITDQFVTNSGDEWHVSHYFLLFDEDFLYKGDIEGVTVLMNEYTEEAVVAYWQYGWLVIKRCKKEEIQGGLDVYLECGMHTALPEPGSVTETVDGMPLGLEETTLLSILKTLGRDVPPYGSTDGKIVIDDIDWEGVSYSLDEGIRRMESWLEEEGVSGAPRTLRFEPLKNFSNRTNYYHLIDPSTKVIDIRSTLSPEGIEYYGFVPSHLTCISENMDLTEEEKWLTFQYILKTREAAPGEKIADLASSEAASLIYFLTGLTLPNDTFWVNLNPSDPETIIDSNLGSTMVGKIMLEADFQMKKDFCRYTNPCVSEIGEKYWKLLDKRREELVTKCMKKYPSEILSVDNVFFSVAIRHWIVPDEITAKEDDGGIYIVDATLNIQSEYEAQYCEFEIVNQSNSLSKNCSTYLDEAKKEYGRYAKELEDELILPLVVRDLNTCDQYADLRQVYYSLALAQWYKSREHDQSLFSGPINFEEIETLSSWIEWDFEDVWKEYVISFQEGEEECYCKVTQEEEGYKVTQEYTGGGIKFDDIIPVLIIIGYFEHDEIRRLEDTSLAKCNKGYCFGNKINALIEEKKKHEDRTWVTNYDRYLRTLSIIAPYGSIRQKVSANEHENIGILVCVISIVITAGGLAVKMEKLLGRSIYSAPEQHQLETVEIRWAKAWGK
ncbi:MAG: hypothetical protein HXS48_20030 [Theionarchaea archaeon]|nr:hypothetical protein [Theionarchaea archaeon]